MHAASTGVVRRTTLASVLTFFVLGIGLCLIAGTVVIALIPVYLSGRSVTVNPDVLTGKESLMIVAVEQNPTVSSGRRRRATGDLIPYTPGVFTPDGVRMVQSKLPPFVVSDGVRGVNVTGISINVINEKERRKRCAIVKRQLYAANEVVLKIKFRMLFLSTCLAACQARIASTIQNKLYNIGVTLFNFTNVPIVVNGTLKTAPRVQFVTVLYVSPIVPGLSPSNTGTTPRFNVNSTTTTPASFTTTGPLPG